MYPNLNLKEKSKKNFGAKIFPKTKSLGLSKKIKNWGAPKWA